MYTLVMKTCGRVSTSGHIIAWSGGEADLCDQDRFPEIERPPHFREQFHEHRCTTESEDTIEDTYRRNRVSSMYTALM